MRVRTKFISMLIVMLGMAPYALNAAEIFSDSFESGDLRKTNQEGFRWTDMSWVTLVDGTHEVWWNNQADNTPKESAHGFPGGDWTCKTGQHCMRFRYAAGESMSEQRFDLGTPHKDLWISYWLRVPINYKHKTSSPSNNKLMAIYMDEYSYKGNGPTIIFSPWSDGKGGSTVDIKWSLGNTVVGVDNQTTRTVPFITYPDDQGKWMQLVFHIKTATSSTSKDGIITMWRKWQDSSTYEMIHNVTNAAFVSPSGGPNGWQRGYLMGWTNPTYESNTEWLLDDFKVSDSSLLGKAPNPPTSLVVTQQ